jgi:hypothetical protein
MTQMQHSCLVRLPVYHQVLETNIERAGRLNLPLSTHQVQLRQMTAGHEVGDITRGQPQSLLHKSHDNPSRSG